MWQVLTGDENQLGARRTELTAALGSNAGVIGGVTPEIEFVIGKRPAPVPREEDRPACALLVSVLELL